MKRIISILHIAVLLFVVSICMSCDAVPEDQEPVIFDDVERIELDGYDSTRFTFDVPNGVSTVVLGVFHNTIQTQGQTILNEVDFAGGNRTGLPGYVKGEVNKSALYEYDPGTKDFDPTLSYNTNGSYWWAVWGYDSDGNLTHASEQVNDTINF